MKSFLARCINRLERLSKDDNCGINLNISPSGKAFILATGPSINKVTKMQWRKLCKEFVIGVNGIYKIFKECNFYCCADIVFIKKHYSYMKKHKPWLLFESAKNWYKRQLDSWLNNLSPLEGVNSNFPHFYTYTHLGNCTDWNRIAFDISKGAYSGNTVVVEAIQVALSAGCKEIYLLGVDLDYSGNSYFYGDDNPNPIYPEGRKDLKPLVDAFEVVKRETEKRGIKIINCSMDSKLEVFPKKKLSDVL